MAVDKPDKSRPFVTMDSIVRSCLMDITAGLERFEQFLGWGLIGYKKHVMDGVSCVGIKSVELPLTAWKAIETPTDYVKWTTIGVRVNGVVREFTQDTGLALFFNDDNQDGVPDAQKVTDPFTLDPTIYDPTDRYAIDNPYWFWGLTNRGEDSGQLYGLAVKGNGTGYFKENKERQEIQFTPTVPADTKIYLQYLVTGYDPTKETLVHAFAEDQIRLYIHWQRHKFSKSSSLGEKQMAKKDYDDEVNRTNSRDFDLSIADVLEVARDAYKLTPSF